MQLDAHVHGDAECGVDRALDRIGFDDGAAALVGEQIDRVRGVVPQQVVGPAAGLAQRIHVGAAEKVGLYIHLLDVELACLDLVVHPLVAGVEAPGVAHHGHKAGFLLHTQDFLAFFVHIAQRDLDLHMFARLQARQGLAGVHLCGRAQNDGVNFFQGQRLVQVGGDVTNAVFVSHLFGFGELTPDQRDDFHAVDVLDAVQVFDAESTRARQGDFDGFAHDCSS